MKRTTHTVLTLIGALGLGLGLAAWPPTAEAGTACDGVWVVVDASYFGGGVSTRCSGSYGSGADALRGAGFAIELAGGFLDRVDGRPEIPDRFTAYWSYWHASRNADGTYSGWSYSNLGANSYHPAKNDAEGWRYVGVNNAVAPGAVPPANPDPPPPPPPPAPVEPVPAPAAPAPAAPANPPAAGSANKPAAGAANPGAAEAADAPADPAQAGETDPAAEDSAAADTTPTPTGSPTPTPSPRPPTPSTAPSAILISAALDAEPADRPRGVLLGLGLTGAALAGLGAGAWLVGRRPVQPP